MLHRGGLDKTLKKLSFKFQCNCKANHFKNPIFHTHTTLNGEKDSGIIRYFQLFCSNSQESYVFTVYIDVLETGQCRTSLLHHLPNYFESAEE